MNLYLSAKNNKVISGPIKVDINIVRTISGLTLPIRCTLVNGIGIGSCVYNDFCTVFNQLYDISPSNCPQYLISNNIGCTCPWYLPVDNFFINEPLEIDFSTSIFSFLASGDFNVDIKATQGTTSILCLNIKYSIQRCESKCDTVDNFSDLFDEVLTQDLLSTLKPYFDTDTSIDLSSKSFLSIDKFTFSGLSNLQSLILSFNKLASIDSYTFNDLVNLVHLNLNNNVLTFIDPLMFANLKSLRELHLSSNLLAVLS